MLSKEITDKIDERWNECFPVSSLRPLALIDLLAYLFFVKKSFEEQPVIKNLSGLTGNFNYTKDISAFSWEIFKELDMQSMHSIFVKQYGLTDVMKEYSLAGFKYSDFFKASLLVAPTPTLLFSSVGIIKIIEAEDKKIQAAIIEYLLHKEELTGTNGQVYLPEYISWLIVSLMDPSATDFIWDPSAGDGKLLADCARYIKSKNAARFQNAATYINTSLLTGAEQDLIQLRIGAMNMMLHNIENPVVEILNVTEESDNVSAKKPTLILSNLFFTSSDNKTPAEDDTIKIENIRKDIFFLNLIIKNLQPGVRVAVVVPDATLYNNTEETKSVRQIIIDKHTLEAVISIPPNSNVVFSGAGILIFNKQALPTGNVWFYKMKNGKEQLDKDGEADDVLNHWKSRSEEQTENADGGFYVSADRIKGNNYNLSFNEYKLPVRKPESPEKKPPVVIENISGEQKIISNTEVPGRKEAVASPKIIKKKEELGSPNIPVKKEKAAYPKIIIQKEKVVNLKKIIPSSSYIKSLADWPKLFDKKNLLIGSIIILVIAIASYYLFFRTDSAANTEKKASINNATPDTLNAAIRQKILNDTPVIKQQEAPVKSQLPIDSAESPVVNDTGENIAGANVELLPSNDKKDSVKYLVIAKAYFYNEPNDRTRRPGYITNRSVGKIVPSTPFVEKNGYVYVTFYNQDGRIAKGWLNKKDLKIVR